MGRHPVPGGRHAPGPGRDGRPPRQLPFREPGLLPDPRDGPDARPSLHRGGSHPPGRRRHRADSVAALARPESRRPAAFSAATAGNRTKWSGWSVTRGSSGSTSTPVSSPTSRTGGSRRRRSPWSRAGPKPGAVVASVREAVRGLDPLLPVSNLRVLDEVLAASVAVRRFLLLVTVGFAIAGLALVCLGVFGTVSQRAVRRRREFAIRLTLGATRGRIVGHVCAAGAAAGRRGSVRRPRRVARHRPVHRGVAVRASRLSTPSCSGEPPSSSSDSGRSPVSCRRPVPCEPRRARTLNAD